MHTRGGRRRGGCPRIGVGARWLAGVEPGCRTLGSGSCVVRHWSGRSRRWLSARAHAPEDRRRRHPLADESSMRGSRWALIGHPRPGLRGAPGPGGRDGQSTGTSPRPASAVLAVASETSAVTETISAVRRRRDTGSSSGSRERPRWPRPGPRRRSAIPLPRYASGRRCAPAREPDHPRRSGGARHRPIVGGPRFWPSRHPRRKSASQAAATDADRGRRGRGIQIAGRYVNSGVSDRRDTPCASHS